MAEMPQTMGVFYETECVEYVVDGRQSPKIQRQASRQQAYQPPIRDKHDTEIKPIDRPQNGAD